ncbi:Bromodomain-containing protein [Aulographum hederae CBS 113979]|uniref:Bromodomain-containing protein n=1 Tax=Aulographum hederae CBS 113979 TaxID=1176131 RepID=A0A6G1HHH9_9PEZI|nr:Bromodomain-containing protein [Aulographum hederae CBS 113979]
MDGKRKAAAASSPDDSRAAKRQKNLPGTPRSDNIMAADTVAESGLIFLKTIRNTKDKTGRNIATHFHELPDPNEFPDYYTEIQMPISLNTIEVLLCANALNQGQALTPRLLQENLNNDEYQTISEVEGDMKRMISNAKQYNDRKSLLYEDADRIRKATSNWMVKHNPAYRDPVYQAVPTPVSETTTKPPPPASRPRRATVVEQQPPPSTPAPAPRSVKSVGRDSMSRQSVGTEENYTSDFTGKTLQEAQDQLVHEMIKYKDEDGLEIFQPFVWLPPRSLIDYYQVIKYLVSLKGVQKKVRGQLGKSTALGPTELKTWAAFEEEMSYIWRNCRQYNEDGSDMYNLSGEFEQIFKKRLAEAKAKVPEPKQQTLKLNMATKPSIKLKFGAGGTKDSPGPQSRGETPGGFDASTPGVIVDNSALERQRNHVNAGMNGMGRNPFSSSRNSSTPIPPLGRSTSAASPPVTNGVKNEMHPRQSPAMHSMRPMSATGTAMLPPSTTPQPMAAGSPHPPHINNHQYGHGPPSRLPQSANSTKAPSDFLIPNLTLSSHPQLGLSKPKTIVIPASPTLIHNSVTFSLPVQHHYLQITPRIPVARTDRPYRIFVIVNGTRMVEVVRPEKERQKGFPLYEGRLESGMVNRLEVECMTEKEGASKELLWEKMTVFVNLVR